MWYLRNRYLKENPEEVSFVVPSANFGCNGALEETPFCNDSGKSFGIFAKQHHEFCIRVVVSMRIRIQLFISMRIRIRIQEAKPMHIQADPDPDKTF